MTQYCIAPDTKGICGKKLPCATHVTLCKYKKPTASICLAVRHGIGAPGVCGIKKCTKHGKTSTAIRPASSHKRKLVQIKSTDKKRRRVLNENNESYSKSEPESEKSEPESEKSEPESESEKPEPESDSEKSDSEKSDSEKPDADKESESENPNSEKVPIPLELAPRKKTIMDSYAAIEKERQKLFKMEFDHSKYISKLISSAIINDESESSLSDTK